jgi:rod shape-determining protein MreC
MKKLFKSRRFKLVLSIALLLLAGAVIAAANGHGETAQSTIVGTVFSPCHYVATKISDGLDKIFTNASGNAEYENKIAQLEEQVGDLQSELVDYENLKKQNELYKEFLELKEENEDYQFEQAAIIARDSADVFGSFTIDKGLLSGIMDGDAVLYGKYLVGVVDKAYPNYSIVKTILDADFNASAYEIVTDEISYVTGNATLAKDGKCKMANLDSTTKITYGSIVCTAGISGTIPKDLIIGTVDEIRDEETDISSYAVITPGVDINSIGSCFVLTNFESED